MCWSFVYLSIPVDIQRCISSRFPVYVRHHRYYNVTDYLPRAALSVPAVGCLEQTVATTQSQPPSRVVGRACSAGGHFNRTSGTQPPGHEVMLGAQAPNWDRSPDPLDALCSRHGDGSAFRGGGRVGCGELAWTQAFPRSHGGPSWKGLLAASAVTLIL